MTRRRTFIGFLAGTTATIALKAGGQTVQASVDDWGENRGETVPQGSVTITPYRNSGTAPAGNIYEAEATGQTGRSYQDVYYLWTFSEGLTFDNLPSDFPWPTSNVTTSYGPVVSWVHKSPGAHTVRCDAWDILTGSYLGFDEVNFTANDLSSFDRVVCIGTDSANMPAGAEGPYADFPAALAATWLHRGKVQYLFERGMNFKRMVNGQVTADEENKRRIRDAHASDVYIGAYGPASAAPEIDPLWFDRQPGEIIVEGVTYFGGFDPTDPDSNVEKSFGTKFSAICTFHTHWNVQAKGIHLIECGPRTVFGNTVITEWGGQGVICGPDPVEGEGFVGFVGCDISQVDGAVLQSQGPKFPEDPPLFSTHGTFRMSEPVNPLCFDMCRIANNTGWGKSFPPWPQVLIRWCENNPDLTLAKLNVGRVVGEGSSLLNVPSASGEADARPQNVVMDKIHFTQLWGGGGSGNGETYGFVLVYSGQTVRNYIGVIPNVPNSVEVSGKTATGHVRIMSYYPATDGDGVGGRFNVMGNENGPFELYGYTLLDQRSTANLYGNSYEAIARSDVVPDTADIRIANGYHWSRDAEGADYRESTDALVSVASWAPHITQTRKATDRATPVTIVTDPNHGATVEGSQVWAPSAPTGVDTTSDTLVLLEGKRVLDPLTVTSHALLPLDDFFGNARTGTYKGAVDPAATGPVTAP